MGYNYKTQIASGDGFVCPPLITNGQNITSFTEDLELPDQKPFILIPLEEGTIRVRLAGQQTFDTYDISEAEVTASIGLPLLYLVTKVYKAGTSISSFNIGF